MLEGVLLPLFNLLISFGSIVGQTAAQTATTALAALPPLTGIPGRGVQRDLATFRCKTSKISYFSDIIELKKPTFLCLIPFRIGRSLWEGQVRLQLFQKLSQLLRVLHDAAQLLLLEIGINLLAQQNLTNDIAQIGGSSAGGSCGDPLIVTIKL